MMDVKALARDTKPRASVCRAWVCFKVGDKLLMVAGCRLTRTIIKVTAAPVTILRSLPIKRLKDYLAAYNIPCIGAKEKEDIVQTVLRARIPTTGCLSPEAEVCVIFVIV